MTKEREDNIPDAATGPAAAGADSASSSGRRASRVMDPSEVASLLARNYWGVLATYRDDQPYAVPIIYGCDGRRFFFVVGPGRKTDNLIAQPRASLTVVEVEDMARRWRSAIAMGTVAWLGEEGEMAAAIDVIRRQYPGMPTRSTESIGRMAAAGFRVACLEADQITGRTQE